MDLFRDLEEDMKYIGNEMQPQLYATEKGDDYSKVTKKMHDALGKDDKSFLEHFGDIVYSAKFEEIYEDAIDREEKSSRQKTVKNSVEKAEEHINSACLEIAKNETKMKDATHKQKEGIPR